MTQTTDAESNTPRSSLFAVRIGDNLRSSIEAFAKKRGCSMDAYAIHALSKAVQVDEEDTASARHHFGPNTPCRFHNEPFLVVKSYFNAGELVTEIVDKDGNELCVGYDELEPY